MQNLHFIPDDITNDVELLSWLEEQAARVAYEDNLALQDEADHQWACF